MENSVNLINAMKIRLISLSPTQAGGASRKFPIVEIILINFSLKNVLEGLDVEKYSFQTIKLDQLITFDELFGEII